MSDLLRYVVSIDPATKAAVKVEQIGEAGELTEVDLAPFIQFLAAGTAGASQPAQVVINVYAGGPPGGATSQGGSQGGSVALPQTIYGIDPGYPSHRPKPPEKPPGKPGEE